MPENGVKLATVDFMLSDAKKEHNKRENGAKKRFGRCPDVGRTHQPRAGLWLTRCEQLYTYTPIYGLYAILYPPF